MHVAKQGEAGVSIIGYILSPRARKSLYILLCILLGNVAYYYLRCQWNLVSGLFTKEPLSIITNEQYGNIMIGTYIMNFIGKFIGGWLIDYTNKPKLVFVSMFIAACVVTLICTATTDYIPIFVLWNSSRIFTTFFLLT